MQVSLLLSRFLARQLFFETSTMMTCLQLPKSMLQHVSPSTESKIDLILIETEFTYDWLTELSRILNLKSDYSEETHHDVLVRNTTIQLCLCIQNSLGFKGEFNSRTFSGKFAWLVLQLRNIVVLVTMAANLNVTQGGPNTEKTTPLEDPGLL